MNQIVANNLKQLRILSIDGGGVRGAIAASFLAKLEADLGCPLHDHFDYIIGTSAGGMLALFLGGLGRSAAEAEALFSAGTASRIMNKDWKARHLPAALLPGPKYDGKGKTAVLNEVFGSARIQSSVVPLLVTGYDPALKRFVAFKSYGGGDAKSNPLMASVADVTSAAPTYFPPVMLDGRYLVDGGIVANNPGYSAIAEAMKAGFRPTDIVMVAVGTGRSLPTPKEVANYRKNGGKWGGLGWLNDGKIIEHLMDGSASTDDYCCAKMLGPRFIRVQDELPDGVSGAMDDTSEKNVAALRATGADWYARYGERVRRAIGGVTGIDLDDAPELPLVCTAPLTTSGERVA